MATIQIKRSTGGDVPGSNLAAGELAYAFGTSGTGPERLFIGSGTANLVIGGKVFADMLDHTAGTLTASSAIITDTNSKIDTLKLKGADNSTPGNIVLDDNDGTAATTLRSTATLSGDITVTLPSATGTLVGTGDTGSVTNGMLAGPLRIRNFLQFLLPEKLTLVHWKLMVLQKWVLHLQMQTFLLLMMVQTELKSQCSHHDFQLTFFQKFLVI